MNIRKRDIVRFVSIAMCLMLLLPTGLPRFAHARSGSDVAKSLHKSLPLQSQNKISEDLTKQFKKKDEVTFLLKMKDQVDTEKVAARAASKAQKNNLSSAKTELKKRTAVVSALHAKSLDTQGNIIQFLQQQKKAGNVKSFESFYIVNAMAVTGTKEVANKLAKYSEVEKILPNRTRHLLKGKQSTAKKQVQKKVSAQSKAIPAEDDAVEPNIGHIGAPEVWDMGIDGTGTVVASIDTGVQWNHPALKEKYRGYDPEHPNQPNNEFNWLDATSGEGTPYDDIGHGTHTVGTMVGSEPDGSNQIGVAPGAQWIAVKAFTVTGGTDVDLLEAGEWILAPKDLEGTPHPEKAPDVVNNSWGGGAGLNEWYRPMVQNWREAGIFPAFAAGNTTPANPGGPGSVSSPGNYPESFAVGATNNDDELADFSLQGPSPYDEIKPEVVAPGVNIRSSVPGNQYDGSYSGTSMATPHIAGTVALLRQADASLTVDEMEQILLNTTKPLTDENIPKSPNNGYGYGGVNAFNAVSAVVSGLGTVKGKVVTEGEDNEAPTYEHEAPGETYSGIDLPLRIKVYDNISIEKVELKYRTSEGNDWKTLEANRLEGNYRDAVYGVTIPGNEVSEPSITYRWHIVDYGRNDVTSDLYEVTVKSGITVGYSQDFESVPVGWTSYGDNNSWEWGKPTSGPGEAFSGEKVYATNLDGDYKGLADMTLMMPPIDLPEGDAYLQFKQWYEFGYQDAGHVLISTDRENWRMIKEIKGKSGDWVNGEVRLSQYSGQRVYIAFHAKTYNPALTYPGWYVDDVSLRKAPLQNDTEPPTYQHEALTQMYVGMNTPIQISVEDNISVSQVELQYHAAGKDEWKTVQSKFVQGDKTNGNGVYRATIPGDAITEPSTITYRWHIVDYGGNEVTSDSHEVPVDAAITVGYSADFETDPGWISFGKNNSWERGVPASGPGGATSGENVYATDLDGDYSDDADMTLMMPPVDLPEGNAYLQFKHWYKLESLGGDEGKVLVSTDQEHWSTVARLSGQSNFWQYVEANLSGYAGQKIYIAFELSTNISMSEPGWYLDDVSLSQSSIMNSTKIDKEDNTSLKKVKAEDTLKKVKDITKKTEELKGKSIDLNTISHGKPKNVQTTISTEKNADRGKTEANVQSLPLNATVSFLETGQFVNTNPSTGSYSMIHPAGTYTLQAEAYGFYSDTQSVKISKDGTVEANFNLQPIPKGTVTGTVTNKATGEPVADATLMLMEDAAIKPVTTDNNGHYSITAYEGDYTLHIAGAEYYSKDIEITLNGNESTEQNVKLEPFIGYPGEIGYDDGTAENARSFFEAGNGWAVKMSLPEGKEEAFVTAGKFRFWNKEWPDPGGTEFQVAIYDASGSDGAPGEKIAGPVDATALRNGEWTIVDLSDEGVIVHGDFYMVYIQTKDDPLAPGLATDQNSPNAGRSWQMMNGAWSRTLSLEGNYMIRAIVDYEASPPVITSPKDNTYTNDKTVTIEGDAAPTTRVTILNNGKEVDTVQTTDKGTFSTDITLTSGDNVVTAKVSTDSGTTTPSEPVTVFLDQEKPELTIDSPKDGWKTNKTSVTVEGNIEDENADWVKVNGKKANLNDDGSYLHRMLLNEGKNVITVVAADKAGNKRSKQITVYAKFHAPEITNLEPSEDVYLRTGESVKIEMDSFPGLDATFTIHKPIINPYTAITSSVIELPMMEMEDGHYVGYWTVPSNWSAKGARIRLIARDDYGNKTEKLADGELYINVPNDRPEADFDASKKVIKQQDITFDGSGSSDPDGSIVKYEWNFGNGQKAKGKTIVHQFSKKGKFKVTLTVTDNRGATDTIAKKINVLNNRGKGHKH